MTTATTELSIRPAYPSDVEALMGLRREAEGWLASAGIDQWSNSKLGAKAVARWVETINGGRTWVVVGSGTAAVATISTGPADPDFWRPSDQPESGWYVYKLIVGRAAAGGDLGGRILDWASLRAKSEGKTWLRLDVWRTNTQLQHYYERHGFSHVRTEAPAHRLSGWMGQRPAGTLTCPGAPLLDLAEIPHPR